MSCNRRGSGSASARFFGPVLLAAAALGGAGAAGATTVSLLQNSSFESTFLNGTFCHALSGNDSGNDNWAWGDSACSVTAKNGITPLDGLRMLEFGGVPGGNISSDVYEIVDLTAYVAEIAAGLVTVDTSAYFDAVSSTKLGMALFSWTGSGALKELAGAYDEFTADGDKTSWQQFGHTGVAVPKEARYLFFGVNHPANGVATYVDKAALLMHIADGDPGTVPEPTTPALIAAALLGWAGTRRRA